MLSSSACHPALNSQHSSLSSKDVLTIIAQTTDRFTVVTTKFLVLRDLASASWGCHSSI